MCDSVFFFLINTCCVENHLAPCQALCPWSIPLKPVEKKPPCPPAYHGCPGIPGGQWGGDGVAVTCWDSQWHLWYRAGFQCGEETWHRPTGQRGENKRVWPGQTCWCFTGAYVNTSSWMAVLVRTCFRARHWTPSSVRWSDQVLLWQGG